MRQKLSEKGNEADYGQVTQLSVSAIVYIPDVYSN